MVTRADKIVFAIIIIAAALAFFILKERKSTARAGVVAAGAEDDKEKKKDKKKVKNDTKDDARVSILQKWEMPAGLAEISGIAFIEGSRFACVQDELGKIFIYNTASSKVEKEIPFGAVGDYEGIAVVGPTAYVMRADGKLFEISAYDGGKPSVRQHSTHLTAKQDVEGLCYDRQNNRLLLAIKGKEAGNQDYKGVYAFDLSSRKLAEIPVYRIDLSGPVAEGAKGKNKMQPSDIAVHPVTGDLYVLDGPDSRLLVMSAKGSGSQLYSLGKSDFPQPEGIDFTPGGDLYISNEGKSGSGNILKVQIRTGQ